jgi:hypothetical protein
MMDELTQFIHTYVKTSQWLGMVAHSFNLSYSGDREWENYSSKPAKAKR